MKGKVGRGGRIGRRNSGCKNERNSQVKVKENTEFRKHSDLKGELRRISLKEENEDRILKVWSRNRASH